MIDNAQIVMSNGGKIALAQASGVNDNMSQSHFHEYFELYFLDSGERIHIIGDRQIKAKAGDVIIFPPHTMHRSYGEKDVPFSRIVLYFYPDCIHYTSVLEHLLADTHAYHLEDSHLHTLRRFLYMLMDEQEQRGDFHTEFFDSLLNTTIVGLSRHSQVFRPQVSETRVGKLIHYIHENYAQDIHLEDLAREFYVSEYYLCREFKKQTNRTIVEYLQRTRIMNAQKLFMETPKNVTEVASTVGFSNLTHFNRVFKEIAGMTPSTYRKQCRERQ